MDDDFFADQGDIATIPNQSTTIDNGSYLENNQQNAQEDDFEFQCNAYLESEQEVPNQPSYDVYSSLAAEEDDTARRIREEE